MANQKAQRQEIEFPPLLNLQEDRPRIASDFKSVEHINAPYINGMLTPLWKRESAYTSRPVWDYRNNKYEVKDGYLTKNGTNLFPVDDYHFEKEDVTEQYSKYLAFDYYEDKIATMEWETETNTLVVKYNGVTITSPSIFISGVILSSRVRAFENTAIAVIVYEISNIKYITYINTAANRTVTKQIHWCTLVPKTSTSDAMTSRIAEVTISSPAPIINIANPLSDVYAVSLISNKNNVLFTRKEGYYTLCDNNGTIIDGLNWVSTDGSSTEVITTYNFSEFSVTYKQTNVSSRIRCVNINDVWYYADEYTTPVVGQDDSNFNPQLTTELVDIEGTNYYVYVQVSYQQTLEVKAVCGSLYGQTVSIEVLTNDGRTMGPTQFSGDNTMVVLQNRVDNWIRYDRRPQVATIHFGGTDYEVTDFINPYTVVYETTSTKTVTYLNCPQVFLDSGELFSYYTIPEVASNNWPVVFPEGCFIVESGNLTGFSSNKFTFSVNEAHLTSSYAKIGRSNSSVCAQNFWADYMKLCSANVKKPYQLYVSGEAEVTASPTACYTDYMNSSCTDMLYHCGGLPIQEFKFFNKATASSEDVAWFNPGGYRVRVKPNSKFNILYYLAEGGSLATQGISYSDTENEMGTLITPFGSISDDGYIVASDDFVIYKDLNNKIWKISIEEGAILEQVFDNKYIIVNTTSYWNMWDDAHNRKFHFSTDYNNRTKIGYDRTKYRATVSSYNTYHDARKLATGINYNYNLLPRLPVSSMFPTTFSLFHTLTEADITPYLNVYGSQYYEAREVQAIEIYVQGITATSTSCDYLASVKVFPNGKQIFKESNLIGQKFSNTKSIIYTTCIFTTYINGAGNNDFAVEGYSKYPLLYNNQSEPLFLYNYAGGLDVENAKWFFVIQGQYYAVIGEKLYAMIYSSGLISQMDAIVDIRDLHYVGNTPAIAFFINPFTKQVYSFTGDANLQRIFDASKFTFKISDSSE